jgi:4-amino-4-deoxy-L-arabinose transferase-like glycosyltransferase
MSKAPTRTPPPTRPAGGSRSFARRQQLERERAARRRRTRQARPPTDLRTLLRRVPAAAWICALIALLNATAWSIITPPFQGRDEVDHFAYVENLVENGKLPHRNPGEGYTYSPGQQEVMNALHYGGVRFAPFFPSISSIEEQKALTNAANSGQTLKGDPDAGGASSAPPLFYALQTIPYVFGGGNVLVKLQLMRLFSALMGGLTAMLVFFFLREVLPSVPWAATVGAICAALQPQFAFTTASVNPDAFIYVCSAATFLCLALGFKRGLTMRTAVVLGLAIAAGFLTYYSFVGVAVGAFVGLGVLAWRGARRRGRQALVTPGVAFGIGASPVVLDGLAKLASKHPAFGQASHVGSALTFSSLFHQISYTWQLFLPRLPGMTHYFEGINTWREIWFDRSVGFYGWMDTMFPDWVDNVFLVFAIVVLLLCAREIYVSRSALKARLPEFASYVVITLGLLAMLGITSYTTDVIEHESALGEPRYLLPLLPLLGAVIVLAIRGAGRRWMVVAGAAMIVLFLGHDVVSQLQVIGRYYG